MLIFHRIHELIVDRDIFGYTVGLHFNDKGSQHKTIIGGLVSILVRVFMIWYAIELAHRINNQDYDNITMLKRPAVEYTYKPESMSDKNVSMMTYLYDSA